MSEKDNVQVVQDLFAAFGRGDLPAILSFMADDVVWIENSGPDTPYSGTFHGRSGVGQFFQKMGETAEFLQFAPGDFIAQGDRVVSLGHMQVRGRATGRTADTDWAMVITLRHGKIARFQNFVDTAKESSVFDRVKA